ncbi:MAG: pectinesterase family protein [Aristaeellaceae bacterium]
MYIIARDGTGDFTSIQAAVDAAPFGSCAPVILLVRMGEYHERVIVNKDNLRIVGEARDRTILTAKGCAKDLNDEGQPKGTFLSATLLVTGNNVTVENLTIRNDAGDGREVGQAVAVYAAGDRGVWRNCRMIAAQDTLFCGPTMPKVARDALPRLIPEGVPSVGDCPPMPQRQYFEDCWIQGDIDFIFGPYRCWFEGCTLFMNERGGFYTAANTPEGMPCGMVFHRCRLTGACPPGQAYLGRPWRAHARTVFLDCEMDECVSPKGFADWEGGAPVTELYGEHGTRGARADQSTRHPKQKRLTDGEAARLTLRYVLGGCDHWRPDKPASTWYACGDETACAWAEALVSLGEGIFVENRAQPGASAKSFVAGRHAGFTELCLRRGDKLLIQFGRADGAQDVRVSTTARGTFPLYLGMLIDAARIQGAEPVLLTPVAAPDGEYAAAMRDLAKTRGVRLLDMAAAFPAEEGSEQAVRQAAWLLAAMAAPRGAE